MSHEARGRQAAMTDKSVPTLLIKEGRVIDPRHGLDKVTDIYVAAGVVAGIGEKPPGLVVDKVISAKGSIVAPGFIDLLTHLYAPGQDYKATIASETRAAATAGVTTLCCSPTTRLIMDTPAVVELVLQRAQEAGYARVLPIGALTQDLAGEGLAEMVALQNAGCVGVSQGGRPILNTQLLRHCFAYAATYDIPVFIQAEDYWLKQGGCAHEGQVSMRLGLTGIPSSAETLEITRCLQLIAESGARAHFSKLSTFEGVALIREAKQRGLTVTADVTAHHLFLTEMDTSDFNPNCRLEPPLRTLRDQQALRQGLQDGTIDAICSDHFPLEDDAKQVPFDQAIPGLSGLETLLPLALHLQENKVLSLPAIIEKMTTNPAQILNVSTGTLGVGAPADICIFDPTIYHTVNPATWTSLGKNTPFIGWELPGEVQYTVLGGRVVFAGEPA